MLPDNIRTWLLDPSNPSLRYRTSMELLDLSTNDPDMLECKRSIASSEIVQHILNRMHPDGYWLQQNPRTKKVVGDGVEYGSFATTHFCLSYLAELGMDRTNKLVDKAAERYLDLQQPDGDWYCPPSLLNRPEGDWYRRFSCLYGYNIVTFVKLGYADDPRIERTISLMIDSIRHDNGYLCDFHELPAGKRPVKSCIRGSTKALEAFAELGEQYWNHESCARLVNYFLNRGGIFKTSRPDELVNKDVQTLIFPFHWRAGLIQILFGLSRLGHGKDPRLAKAWELLYSKADSQGRYPLDWTPSQSLWKVGQRGSPNQWLTFYSYLAMKYRDES